MEYTKKECLLNGTGYCESLTRDGCVQCVIYDGKEDTQKRIMSEIDVIRELLPDGSMDGLTEARECQLCSGENKHKPVCYAIVDLGHKEPRSDKRNFLGIKVKADIGAIVTAQIPCCKQCRKDHRVTSLVGVATLAAFMLVALVLLTVTPLSGLLEEVHPALPLALFVAVLLAGYGIGKLIELFLRKRAAKRTRMQMSEVPFIARMYEKGWFPVSADGKKPPRLVFSKERLKRGWFV